MRVQEKMVLRIIFVPKREVVKGDRRNLNNEELYKQNSSLNNFMTIKSIGIIWAGHLVHMEDRGKRFKI
jgi:hypothetical protein